MAGIDQVSFSTLMPNAGTVLRNLQRGRRSSFAGHSVRGLHSGPFYSIFEGFNRSRAQSVVRDFEKKHKSPNSLALSEYIKALVTLELQAQGSSRFLPHIF
jgi:hypothetical protein